LEFKLFLETASLKISSLKILFVISLLRSKFKKKNKHEMVTESLTSLDLD